MPTEFKHLHQLFLGHMDRYYDWLAGREMTEDSMRQLLTDTDNFIWEHSESSTTASVFNTQKRFFQQLITLFYWVF